MNSAGPPARGVAARLLAAPFLALVHVYRVLLSPLMAGQCRFHPTCSEYALEAYRVHNPLRASWLVAGRLLRCQPLARSGYDPVPAPLAALAPRGPEPGRGERGAESGPAAPQAGQVSVR